MTDSTPWQAPGGEPQPAQPRPFGEPQGPATPPGYGGAPGGQPGWTPPPRPGLIPLRPLSFGTLLGASFQVMRRNPRPTFGVALLLNGAITLLFAGVIGTVAFIAFSRIGSASAQDADEIGAGAIAIGAIASLIPIGLSVVISGIMQGIISLEVARATLGEKLRFGGLWRLAKGRLGALIGWTALITVTILVFIVVATLIIVAVSLAGEAGPLLAVGVGLLLGGGALILSIWIGIKVSLVPSVLMLERVGLFAAVARSWRLTNGFFWKTLGITLLVNVVISTINQIISIPLSFISGIGTTLINPTQDPTAGVTIAVIGVVLTLLASLVISVIGSVVASSVLALIYIDIRMRREGLDLELTRYAEARQDGDTSVQNPYERLWTPAAPTPATGYSAPAAPPASPPPTGYAPPAGYAPPTGPPAPPTGYAPPPPPTAAPGSAPQYGPPPPTQPIPPTDTSP